MFNHFNELMHYKYILLVFLLLALDCFSQPIESWDHEKIEVKKGDEQNTIISANRIIAEGWADLAQPKFWKQIMTLTPDSCLINIARTREVIVRMSVVAWNSKSDDDKDQYRDSIRKARGLDEEARIFFTTGKNDFYQFKKVYPTLSEGIEEFEMLGVDPWYAQAILLIESPGQLKKSRAGAYGPFQLMPKIARAQGLIVNRSMDEREDFKRSAYGSARLISRICIPEAKRILDTHGLVYNENEIWFRLFVLHVYHAGGLNVAAVVKKIDPKKGDKELIKAMWINSAANFRNSSQNYSQLVLASQLILHEMVYEDCDYILDCAEVH
jgi:hypothetical protein